MHSWRISLCKVYTVLQILYLQLICRRYLQRSNYLSTSALHAFRCRWQMFSCFFGSSSNLVVISFLFQLSSSFLILLKVVAMFAF
ncbi:hypothetical protein DWX70_23310 [Bacteroides ovatus]|uniref:Uncharacterized protein n=1 Tax=Bacteroides ovatus TaxID=28116 RepID=A0A395VQP7_BACOV|nr:hypothetical protein DWX70_23310 [Bacteroides ovatus]